LDAVNVVNVFTKLAVEANEAVFGVNVIDVAALAVVENDADPNNEPVNDPVYEPV
jgi:hypothetical protein